MAGTRANWKWGEREAVETHPTWLNFGYPVPALAHPYLLRRTWNDQWLLRLWREAEVSLHTLSPHA